MPKPNIKILIVSYLLLQFTVIAQNSETTTNYFKSREFGQYFISDRYAPIIKIGTGITFVHKEYDISATGRDHFITAEPVVGGQIPIFLKETKDTQWSLSLPVSFSVWFDYLEKQTAPILNTDYRFALIELNYSKVLENRFIRNIGFKFIPFFHESTHLGDELALDRIRDGIPTTRINVSYETTELAVMVNDPYDQNINNHAFRLGAKFLLGHKDGYYTADPVELAEEIDIAPSTRWIEPYLQYQYQNSDGKISNDKMMFVLSLDLNLRVSYGYPYYNCYHNGDAYAANATYSEEKYVLSSNLLVGYRFYSAPNELSQFGAYLNLYYGINPHGQFRTIPEYPWVGLSFIYELK